MSATRASARTVFQIDPQSNTSKFYRTYVIDGVVIYQWGRIGTKGQFKVEMVNSVPSAAVAKAESQTVTKERKGYTGRVVDNFMVDPARLTWDAAGCDALYNIYAASSPKGNPLNGRSIDPTPAARKQTIADLPIVSSDALGQFTERAQRAITLSITNPKDAAIEYAKLNTEFEEHETAVERARSFLSTLDMLVSQ